MNAMGSALFWCAIQVTLFGLVAAIVYLAARRAGPGAGVRAAFGGLSVVAALSLLAFNPWPNWTRLVVSPEIVASNAGESAKMDPGSNLNRPDAMLRSSEPDATAADPTADYSPTAQQGVRLTEFAWTLWDELRRIPSETPPETDVAIAAADTSTWNRWNWRSVAMWFFMAAAALGFVRLMAGLFAVGRLDQLSRPITDARLSEMVDILRAKLGCTRPVTLRESSQLATAATIGWRKPVILLPTAWQSWSTQQQNAVLAHELAHVCGGDFLTQALGQLGVVLHFYNPLVHWLSSRLRLEQELRADAAAGAATGGRRAYLTTLAEIALQQPNNRVGWPAHAFLPTRGMFLRRIEMLRNKKDLTSTTRSVATAARWATVCILVVAGLAVAGLRGVAKDVDPVSAVEPTAAADAAPQPAKLNLKQYKAKLGKSDSTTTVEFRLAENEPGEGLTKATLPESNDTVYLHRQPFLTRQHIASARVTVDDNNYPALEIQLTKEGGRIMKQVTSSHLPDRATGKRTRIAIFTEGKILAAPSIMSTISTDCLVHGSFEVAELEKLVAIFSGKRSDQIAATDAADGEKVAPAIKDGTAAPFDFSYVPEDTAWMISSRPAKLFQDERLKRLLKDANESFAITDGFSWSEIEQVTIAWHRGLSAGSNSFYERTIVRVTPDVDLKTRHAALANLMTSRNPREELIGGKQLFVSSSSDRPSRPAYCIADQQTLVFDHYDRLRRFARSEENLLDPKRVTSLGNLQDAHVMVYAQSPQIRQMIAREFSGRHRGTPQLPGGAPMQMVSPLWNNSEAGLLIARLNDRLEITGAATCQSADSAKEVARTAEALATLGKNLLTEQHKMLDARVQSSGVGSSLQVVEKSLYELGEQLLLNAQVQANDQRATLVTSCEVEMASLAKALVPATRQARESADRTRSLNHLKQIALAMHNYADTKKCFPPAVLYGPDGKTPYSWRVALLPYLGDEVNSVYEQYKFDEPWDSEHNRALLDKMPAVYGSPKDDSDSTNTSYFVLTGPETMFCGKDEMPADMMGMGERGGMMGGKREGTDSPKAASKTINRGMSFRLIRDGTAHTLLIVEAKRDVPWTKPVDIPYAADKRLPKLGGWFEQGFCAAFCDGHVRFLASDIDEKTLRAWITRAGGEVILDSKAGLNLRKQDIHRRLSTGGEPTPDSKAAGAIPAR